MSKKRLTFVTENLRHIMRKLTAICMLLAIMAGAYAQRGYSSSTYTNDDDTDFYLESKFKDRKSGKGAFAGIVTRLGYSYNDDAFTYGISAFYHFGGIIGVGIGFDGYYIPDLKIKDADGNIVQGTSEYAIPMWDIRAGFMLGKYIAFGGIIGKCRICSPTHYHDSKNLWGSSIGTGIYGGYITFLLPLTTHFGANFDFALTNHTGFNIAIGFNFTFPVKK